MITALVLLPLVISISSPLFLPSWMVRLVGAEFGEAMAITLFIAINVIKSDVNQFCGHCYSPQVINYDAYYLIPLMIIKQ